MTVSSYGSLSCIGFRDRLWLISPVRECVLEFLDCTVEELRVKVTF